MIRSYSSLTKASARASKLVGKRIPSHSSQVHICCKTVSPTCASVSIPEVVKRTKSSSANKGSIFQSNATNDWNAFDVEKLNEPLASLALAYKEEYEEDLGYYDHYNYDEIRNTEGKSKALELSFVKGSPT